MRLASLFAASFAACLPAQFVETVGGMASQPVGGNFGKSSLYRVDSSRLLFNFEVHLNLAGPDNITFFAYRHPQRDGNATLEWTLTVPVTGGGGPQWYSSGPIALPLVCNNYYLLGASWSLPTTVYYYTVVASGSPVSFGAWIRARTHTLPLSATTPITGSDGAQYYQRITTLPLGSVGCVGTGCGSVPPRLVASATPTLGTTVNLHITNASPSGLGVYAFTFGPTLPSPVTLFGCPVWLNLGGGAVTNGTILDSLGFGTLPLSIPNNPSYTGMQLSLQSGVLSGPSINVSNAVDLTL